MLSEPSSFLSSILILIVSLVIGYIAYLIIRGLGYISKITHRCCKSFI